MKFPKDFAALGTHCGIKKKSAKDLAVFYSKRPCAAAGAFTRNIFRAAAVEISSEKIRGKIRAILANSGCANACTGTRGRKDAEETCRRAAAALGINPAAVLVASTGVIGRFLPMKNISAGIKTLSNGVSRATSAPKTAAEAIMTTDTFPKYVSAAFDAPGGKATIWGCAKGSGMIAPNMATMLSFILTDAAVERPALEKALRAAVKISFNRLTVDGDTSTNDTVLILANGAAQNKIIAEGGRAYPAFETALKNVCLRLTRMLAADGEGATKLIEVEVAGARDENDAARAAKCVAESPLVKTAIYGLDANWGRVVAALGRSGVKINPRRTAVKFGRLEVFRDGRPVVFSESRAKKILSAKRVFISADIGAGKARARFFTCDFSENYVKVNAAYRT